MIAFSNSPPPVRGLNSPLLLWRRLALCRSPPFCLPGAEHIGHHGGLWWQRTGQPQPADAASNLEPHNPVFQGELLRGDPRQNRNTAMRQFDPTLGTRGYD